MNTVPKPNLLVTVLSLLVTSCFGQSAPQIVSPPKSARDAVRGQSIVIGHPAHLVDPVLSDHVRKQNLATVLYGTITANGGLEGFTVVGGDTELNRPALDAVQQWSYSPATRDGQPIDIRVYITIRADHGKVKAIVEPDLAFPEDGPDLTYNGVPEEQPFKVGGEVKAPKPTYAPPPQFSEAARAAKHDGTVELGLIVKADGTPGDIWVKKKTGFGLDQQAVQTARQWRFRPATKDGKPVAVITSIEMSFKLY
jgi:TonB family protein